MPVRCAGAFEENLQTLGHRGFDTRGGGPPCRTYSLGKSLTWRTARGGRGCRGGRRSSMTIFSVPGGTVEFGGGVSVGSLRGTELTHFGGKLAVLGEGGGTPWVSGGTRWTDHAWEEDSSRTPCKGVKRIGSSAAPTDLESRDGCSFISKGTRRPCPIPKGRPMQCESFYTPRASETPSPTSLRLHSTSTRPTGSQAKVRLLVDSADNGASI